MTSDAWNGIDVLGDGLFRIYFSDLAYWCKSVFMLWKVCRAQIHLCISLHKIPSLFRPRCQFAGYTPPCPSRSGSCGSALLVRSFLGDF